MDNSIIIKPFKNGFSGTDIVHLKNTRDTKIKIQALHIPDSKNNDAIHHYTIKLSVWKRKKKTNDFEPFLNKDDDFEDATNKEISITDEEAIDNLLEFLISQHQSIGKTINQEYILTDKQDYLEISEIKKYLFDSNLSSDDLDNLDGIINIKKYSTAKDALSKLVSYIENKEIDFLWYAKSDPATCIYEANQKEKFFQNWIENNLWVFGTSYIRKLDTTSLSFKSDSDLVMETLDGFYELIEIKLPSVKLFNLDSSHDSYYPTADLSQAISQVLKYLQDVAEYKHNIEKSNNTTILFPKAKLIIGNKCQTEQEKEALRRLNSSLNNLEILTYDTLLKNADKLIELYKNKHLE